MIVNLLHWLGAALMLVTLWAAVQFDGIPADRPHRKDGDEAPPMPKLTSLAPDLAGLAASQITQE